MGRAVMLPLMRAQFNSTALRDISISNEVEIVNEITRLKIDVEAASQRKSGLCASFEASANRTTLTMQALLKMLEVCKDSRNQFISK